VINGHIIVKDGELQTVDLTKYIRRHNQIALNLLA
jgi:hypothetical protein